MPLQIAAFTESHSRSYPGYVNITQTDAGHCRFAIREPGAPDAAGATLEMTFEQLEQFLTEGLRKLMVVRHATDPRTRVIPMMDDEPSPGAALAQTLRPDPNGEQPATTPVGRAIAGIVKDCTEGLEAIQPIGITVPQAIGLLSRRDSDSGWERLTHHPTVMRVRGTWSLAALEALTVILRNQITRMGFTPVGIDHSELVIDNLGPSRLPFRTTYHQAVEYLSHRRKEYNPPVGDLGGYIELDDGEWDLPCLEALAIIVKAASVFGSIGAKLKVELDSDEVPRDFQNIWTAGEKPQDGP